MYTRTVLHVPHDSPYTFCLLDENSVVVWKLKTHINRTHTRSRRTSVRPVPCKLFPACVCVLRLATLYVLIGRISCIGRKNTTGRWKGFLRGEQYGSIHHIYYMYYTTFEGSCGEIRFRICMILAKTKTDVPFPRVLLFQYNFVSFK